MTKSRKKLKRAVVDTNVFVSGLILERGYPYLLIQKLKADSFILVTSPILRSELEEVLRRTKFSKFLSEAKIVVFMRLIDAISTVVFSVSTLPVEVRDPKDKPILATALGGKVDYLVTGDEDLLVLKNNPKLRPLKIVTVREFLET